MSVSTYLRQRASAAVLSTSEKASIATSIATLKIRLNAYFGADLSEHFTFGSYTRDTILPRAMDRASDIDYMVVWKAGGYQPQTYLDRLKKFVEYYYSRSEISQSNPTIRLELNHIMFELVPALRSASGYGYQIPSGTQAWQSTDPNDFNSTLAAKNASERYLLKPAIRLAKYWNAKNGYVYDSYLFERLIVGFVFWNCSSERDYLFTIFDKLSVPTGTLWQKNAVERAKRIVAEVRSLEASGYPATAEVEVKKLVPDS